jgi:hypothetical protein
MAPPAPAASESGPAALSLIDPRLRAVWPDNPDGVAWFASDGYQLHALHAGKFVALRAPTAGDVDDAVITGNFRKVGGPPGGGYGLIVGDARAGAGDGLDQNGQFIVAGIGDQGEVGIWRRDNDRWVDLLPWTASASVHPGGGPNELTVDLSGRHLRFDVNGVHVASIDAPLAEGRIGIFVGGDLNHVVVDRLVLTPRGAPGQQQLPAVATMPRLTTTTQNSRRQQDASDLLGDIQRVFDGLGGDRGNGVRFERITAMLAEIEREVVAMVDGFSGGVDNPRGPVNNPAELDRAASHLQNATHTAEQLRDEMQDLRDGLPGVAR